MKQPIGVVAAFAPWNFPIGDAGTQDRGASLGAGCACIIKPAEEDPGDLPRRSR